MSYFLSLRQKWRRFLVAHVAWKAVKLILWTCRIEIEGLKHFVQAAEKGPCILAFWHNRIAAIPYFLHQHASKFPFCAVISRSRDGQLLSAVAAQYASVKTIAVAHDSRHTAVKAMLRSLQEGMVILITPDGPRGPCYRVKAGAVLGARMAKAQIVPLSWSASSFWQLNTWDRLLLPKPFAKIQVRWSPPLSFSTDSLTTLEEDVEKLEKVLQQTTLA